jgi:hypothetical protein
MSSYYGAVDPALSSSRSFDEHNENQTLLLQKRCDKDENDSDDENDDVENDGRRSKEEKHPAIFWDNFATCLWLIADILWTENNSIGVYVAPWVVVGYAKAHFTFQGNWERYSLDMARTMALCFWILGNTTWLFYEYSDNYEKTDIDARFMFPYNNFVILGLFLCTACIEPGFWLYHKSKGIDWFENRPVLKPIGKLGMTFWATKDIAWYMADEEILKGKLSVIPKVMWAFCDFMIIFTLLPLFFSALFRWKIFDRSNVGALLKRTSHVIDELAMSTWAVSMTFWSFGEIFRADDTFAQDLETSAAESLNLRWVCGRMLIFGSFPFFVKVVFEIFVSSSMFNRDIRKGGG